jgi:hypothetical protein
MQYNTQRRSQRTYSPSTTATSLLCSRAVATSSGIYLMHMCLLPRLVSFQLYHDTLYARCGYKSYFAGKLNMHFLWPIPISPKRVQPFFRHIGENVEGDRCNSRLGRQVALCRILIGESRSWPGFVHSISTFFFFFSDSCIIFGDNIRPHPHIILPVSSY